MGLASGDLGGSLLSSIYYLFKFKRHVVMHLKLSFFRISKFVGKSDLFCILELINSRLQTQTEYKTLSSNWKKIFTLLRFQRLNFAIWQLKWMVAVDRLNDRCHPLSMKFSQQKEGVRQKKWKYVFHFCSRFVCFYFIRFILCLCPILLI